ncbi:MAG: ATP-binding cassette domain-containing protein [Anaerolineae bacterium]|nr:ATP-binding cassette domain-containing protein [Anaerolineae bacterium]
MIQADNLTKYYGSRAAIKNVSFKVHNGEILGFLGPNGAGKTTTMRVLTAYIPPSDGTVTVGGFDVFTDSLEVRRRIGYLPESVPLYNDMTVRDYLDYVAALRRIDQRAKRIIDAVEKVNLGDELDTLIGKLSKGMRQRVGIAQAVIHDPEVLILDEPTIGLDPKQIIEVRELIRALGGDHTIILSTHILSEVEHICNRVLIMNQGQIVAEDSPAGLAARLEGGERIILRTLQATPEAGDQLQSLPFVKKVVTIDLNTFEIECVSGSDCRAEVAQMAVEQGWGILELNSASVSLEDIFLELTAEQAVVV